MRPNYKNIVERRLKSLKYRAKYLLQPIADLNTDVREQKIVVSLTTYGRRIYNVDLTIRSLLNQTYKPDVIILNLAHKEFNNNNIPNKLKRLEKYGLLINYTDDLLSYKKLIPTLSLYPDDLIITVDDDVLYPNFLIENLINAYNENPKKIYGYRGYTILHNNQQIAPYKKWEKCKKDKSGMNIMLTGVGGVLYWPGCFHPDLLRQDLFMSLAPTADDIWFKIMTTLNNVPNHCIKYNGRFKKNFLYTNNSSVKPLNIKNKAQGQNDIVIKSMLTHYPDLIEKLKV